MDIPEAKDLLRKEMQGMRQNLSFEERVAQEDSIIHQLLSQLSEMDAKVVHTYLPMNDEIDFYPVISHLLSIGVKIVCPKTLKRPHLKHLELSSLDELEEGNFGTTYPFGDKEYYGEYDAIIVPGLAFDKDLNRLGYGAGYYDNFLKNHPSAKKIALAFDFQLVENVPVDNHDISVDKILVSTKTESSESE